MWDPNKAIPFDPKCAVICAGPVSFAITNELSLINDESWETSKAFTLSKIHKALISIESLISSGPGATTILVVLGLVAAYVATFFVDTNILTLILSFSPGGIYEVAVIAIAFDLDPNFVAFHHIIRLLIILFLVPIILKFLKKANLKN